MALNAHPGRQDAESETFITHALRADGFDASEDGTGRGTPLVFNQRGREGGAQAEVDADGLAAALRSGSGGSTRSMIAFTSKDHGADAGEFAPTLRAMGHAGSHANAGGQVAVAFGWNKSQSQTMRVDVTTGPLQSAHSTEPAVATFDPRNVTSKANRTRVDPSLPASTLHEQGLSIIGPSVRRLTPRECERLQGFPDDYTLVPYRGKPAADDPRYKALGNSMAVPVVRWIGSRIV